MEPTLHPGSVVLVDKIGPRLRGVHREDVVVFASPQDGRESVKRVVAVAGQQVAIRDAELYVDDVLVVEPQVDHSRVDGLYFGPVTVPDGAVFVLGRRPVRVGRLPRLRGGAARLRSTAASRWRGDRGPARSCPRSQPAGRTHPPAGPTDQFPGSAGPACGRAIAFRSRTDGNVHGGWGTMAWLRHRRAS